MDWLNLTKLTTARVLVIGDVMLDRYLIGDTSRISPEAPVPVVTINDDQYRPGGAANVALNAASLGAQQVYLVAVTGSDTMSERLESMLSGQGVTCNFSCRSDYQTITKTRVMSHDQQLVRLDVEQPMPADAAASLLPLIEPLVHDVDVVVFSDYGKGTLPIFKAVAAMAKQHGLPVLVDPKTRDFTAYAGASLITPNYKEFQEVVGECVDEPQFYQKAAALVAQHNLASLLVTRGKHGMSLFQAGQKPIDLATAAREVYDVSGAGDTVIASMAVAIAAKLDLVDAAEIANIAAGIVVGKLGTATVTNQELMHHCTQDILGKFGVVDLRECKHLRQLLKLQHKRLVMTNGCFDLLHPGHLQYLREAKALGDYLLVAVNSDASIKRIKGNSRPINKLQDRMTMLAALEMVDWVVPFAEDTPEALYAELLPDILVKGGDYQVEEVAGHRQVLANGGSVKILSFLPNYSSSTIISRIKNQEELPEVMLD